MFLTLCICIFEQIIKDTITMKKLFIVFALASTTVFAQENKNKLKETVVTKTTVTDNEGSQVSTKAVSNTKKQVIALDKDDANKVNQHIVMKPMEVKTDVSYGFEGNRYQFISQRDKDGYRLMTVKDNAKNEEYAVIKPSTQNGYYILSQKGKSSFGYFNADGNFVVERYDEEKDAIVSDVYKIQEKSDKRSIKQ